MVNTHKNKAKDENKMDEELKVKLYKDVGRAVDILESVRATLWDYQNADDISDALHYIIKDLDHDILEGIANLPTE